MNITLYKFIPRRLSSYLMYRLARISKPIWLKNTIIKSYMILTGANTNFAKIKDPYAYKHLNDFFTRAIDINLRSINNNKQTLSSPVDGRCATFGQINDNYLLQAKGFTYTLEDLLGDKKLAKQFFNGQTATLYLAPDDYHRIHMPCDGTLRTMRFCPGDKHSVSLSLLNKIPNIFSGNERVVCLFDTDFGLLAMVLVGALNVSSIETVWHGEVTNQKDNFYHYQTGQYHFQKGDEIGRFNLGSTVILIATNIEWRKNLLNGTEKILMGQAIAKIKPQT